MKVTLFGTISAVMDSKRLTTTVTVNSISNSENWHDSCLSTVIVSQKHIDI